MSTTKSLIEGIELPDANSGVDWQYFLDEPQYHVEDHDYFKRMAVIANQRAKKARADWPNAHILVTPGPYGISIHAIEDIEGGADMEDYGVSLSEIFAGVDYESLNPGLSNTHSMTQALIESVKTFELNWDFDGGNALYHEIAEHDYFKRMVTICQRRGNEVWQRLTALGFDLTDGMHFIMPGCYYCSVDISLDDCAMNGSHEWDPEVVKKAIADIPGMNYQPASDISVVVNLKEVLFGDATANVDYGD